MPSFEVDGWIGPEESGHLLLPSTTTPVARHQSCDDERLLRQAMDRGAIESGDLGASEKCYQQCSSPFPKSDRMNSALPMASVLSYFVNSYETVTSN